MLAGSSWPFATAAWVFERLSGVPVSAKPIRQVKRRLDQRHLLRRADDAVTAET